jgi:type II secretion system protein N
MKARLIKIAKWLAYPAFYLFCLGLFGYLTFPYDRLKDRLIAEFDRAQQKRGSGPPQRLEIDHLDAYWFTGVEVNGARLILPPPAESSLKASAAAFTSGDAAKDGPPKPSVIDISEGHARLKLLPLLLGRVRISFWANVFGGDIDGTIPVGKSSGDVHIEVSNVELGKVEPLVDMLGLPLAGTVSAMLDLSAPEGKFNKANGELELTAKDVSVGDGKTKIQGLIALPEAKLGELSLSAEAKDGVLKVTKMAAAGMDVELAGDGKVNMREPWNSSIADLYVRFKFTDAYRTKNDLTKSLLGAPGSTLPGLIEMQQPKMKTAKRTDGFYGWHVHGTLKKPRFDPQAADSPAMRNRGKTSDSPFPAPGASAKKAGGLNLPLGPAEAGRPKEEREGAPPPPPEEDGVMLPNPSRTFPPKSAEREGVEGGQLEAPPPSSE